MKATHRQRMHAAIDAICDVIDEVLEERGERLLTIAEVADRLRFRDVSSVNKRIRDGRLIAVREEGGELRVREADLVTYERNLEQVQAARRVVENFEEGKTRQGTAAAVLRAS